MEPSLWQERDITLWLITLLQRVFRLLNPNPVLIPDSRQACQHLACECLELGANRRISGGGLVSRHLDHCIALQYPQRCILPSRACAQTGNCLLVARPFGKICGGGWPLAVGFAQLFRGDVSNAQTIEHILRIQIDTIHIGQIGFINHINLRDGAADHRLYFGLRRHGT